MSTDGSRREQALVLAEQLLDEIELGQLKPSDVARKASRLARLLDDIEAMEWLRYETVGFPQDRATLDDAASRAAEKSNRGTTRDGVRKFWTASLAELEAQTRGAEARLASEAGPAGGGQWDLVIARESSQRRGQIAKYASESTGIIERVVGAIHQYVASTYQQLRFGSAVESAFEVVRADVDTRIGELVPGVLPMITGAFENASSDNPEHWANAASTCRRLLKAVADRLRPPGPDITTQGGRTIAMGQGNYLNRLGDWVRQHTESETTIAVFEAEVGYLDAQLKAADKAGQKGAHEEGVSQLEASRFVAGAYLILGDVLRLAGDSAAEDDTAEVHGETVVKGGPVEMTNEMISESEGLSESRSEQDPAQNPDALA